MKKRVWALGLAALSMLSVCGCQMAKIENAYELNDYSQYVTLGDYKDLSIDVTKNEITDADVKSRIDAILAAKGETTQITDRTVQSGDTICWNYKGIVCDEGVEAMKNAILESYCEPIHITDRVVEDKDTINLDYTGLLDGEPFDRGSAEGYTYTIGGKFIKDLNDQLIGLECGKEYDLPCTFPEDYAGDMAGKEVIFRVKVNYIHGEKDLSTKPEWTDEFVEKFTSGNYKTTEEMEKYLKVMGDSEDAAYTLSGGANDGFGGDLEKQLVDSEVGKEYTVTCTYPENFATYPELSGMTAEITYTVKYIEGEKILPEWNDAFVAEYSENEYKTTADYEKHIREDLETNAADSQKTEYENKLWAKIIENCPVSDYPADELETAYQRFYNQYVTTFNSYAQQYGVSYDEFLASYGMYYFGVSSDEELQKACHTYAEDWMKYVMISAEISKAEGIYLPKEEFESEEQSIVDGGNYPDTETLEKNLGTDYLMNFLMYQKVGKWLLENNKQIEVEATQPETTKETVAETEAQ